MLGVAKMGGVDLRDGAEVEGGFAERLKDRTSNVLDDLALLVDQGEIIIRLFTALNNHKNKI